MSLSPGRRMHRSLALAGVEAVDLFTEKLNVKRARAAARERRHRRILGAVEEIFALQGDAKATVDEIARRAGVSKGLVYDHYDSKEEFLRAVRSRQVEAWMSETRRPVKADDGAAEPRR